MLEGGAKTEEGDGIACMNCIAPWAVVEVDVPGRRVTLDAEGACHPAKGPCAKPVGGREPMEAAGGVKGDVGVLWKGGEAGFVFEFSR